MPERLSAHDSLGQAAQTLRRERTTLLADHQLYTLAATFSAPPEHIDSRQAGCCWLRP